MDKKLKAYEKLIRQSLHEIKALKAELNRLKQANREPIAIIGMGCRFPGANSPEAFWQLLRDGVDAIREIPSDRWDVDAYYDPNLESVGQISLPATTPPRFGGFVEQLAEFDAQFFGISPREAVSLDPQQRLLLEVSWEALENAAMMPPSATGVFVGISQLDYREMMVKQGAISPYFASGNAHSTASGRLSYFLGLTGPCLSIDTACSSSLVAVHQALISLQRRECDLALVGGVHRLIGAEESISSSKARMLAPDGRCKTFDAAANGYGRAEGCGIIVLKRLSDAQADGDNILALIRGSAINQDGRTSGLTVPNGPQQVAVIRQALANSGITPEQVSYVEAHGTGTSLGDPIEIGALGTVFSQRSQHLDKPPRRACRGVGTPPLIIGSVKTNIGHLEAAAGIAGLIKVVLSMQHGEIPPNLHFHQPNPHINWDQLPVSIPTERIAWVSGNRFAGVSSFGFSGTNSHVVLEEAPEIKRPTNSVEPEPHILTLSAKKPEALQELAQRYVAYLISHPDIRLADICFTANSGRKHFRHRFAAVAESKADLHEQLEAFAQSGEGRGEVTSLPKIAFLFTGQGSQYVGMGRQLYETQPIFRQALERCDDILRPYLDQSLLSILYPDRPERKPPPFGKAQNQGRRLPLGNRKSKIENRKSKIHETAYTQPALFALEYALAQVWRSWGIEPDVVMGHSVGEYVAACVAGVFSLEDALKLIAERGRLMQALPHPPQNWGGARGGGAMVSVMANESRIQQVIAPVSREVSIAAINGPQSVVISGKRESVMAIAEQLAREGIKARQLTVSHAFHSPLMEPMLDEFRQVAASISYHLPRIPLVGNVTGKLASDEVTTPDYWVRHVREAVRFADGVGTLHEEGINVFLEIGPKPTLLGMVQRTVVQSDPPHLVTLPSLRENKNDWMQMLTSLGELYERGVEVDWAGFDREYQRRKVVLPTYPFQRDRYWVKTTPLAKRQTAQLTPLIDKLIRSPRLKEIVCETNFSVERLPFLADHLVFGEIVSPGACQLAMALEAAHLAYPQQAVQLVDVVLPQALVLALDSERTVQVVFSPGLSRGVLSPRRRESSSNGAEITFELISFQAEQAEETLQTHASGMVAPVTPISPLVDVDIALLQTGCPTAVDLDAFDAFASAQQIQFGPTFRWLAEVWCGKREVIGRLLLPEAIETVEEYQLHPALLDACLQLTSALQLEDADENAETWLPFALDSLMLFGEIKGREWWCHAQLRDSQRWHIQLLDNAGTVLAQVEGFTERAASRQLVLGTEAWREWLYQVQWQPQPSFGHLPTYLPNLTTLTQVLDTQGTEWLTAPNVQQQVVALRQLSPLCVDYILAAFAKAGLYFLAGTQWQSTQLARQLGVIPAYRRLLERLLQILSEAGILRPIGHNWQVLCTPQLKSPQDELQRLQTQYGALVEAEVNLLARCAKNLSEVMRGTQEPLELLFPGGDITLVNRTYQESPIAKAMNRIVQQAVKSALAQLPAGHGVRILEIGAGTGGTTAGILPLLPSAQTDYLFTDIGAGFLSTAQEKFADYPFVRYQRLDIEQSPAEQGVDLYQYDIVIAANVLHATRDLPTTLAHVRQLLLPGGLLLLLESTSAESWVDLTFGLTDGWWRFDDQRQTHPLMPVAEWEELLLKCGFQAVIRATEKDLGENVLLAQVSATDIERVNTGRTWLLFADQSGLGEALAAQLYQRGELPILVYTGAAYQQVQAKLSEGLKLQTFYIRPDYPADYEQLLAVIPDIYGVVQLWALCVPTEPSAEALTDALRHICTPTLHLVQALLHHCTAQPHLWLVTRDAQAVLPNDRTNGVAQAALWGLGRTVALEHPECRCQCIDLDGNVPLMEQAASLCAVLISNSTSTTDISAVPQKEQVALRDNARYVARLVAHEQTEKQTDSLTVRSDATYLLTGGLGGLGLQVSRWLVEQGARHLLLLGRSQPTPIAQQQIKKLEALGAVITVRQVDVSQREQVAQGLAQIPVDAPLGGVIHAAGVLDDGALLHQNWEKFEKVLAPKVYGAWHLHSLTQELPIDFFVLFSSTTGLLGNKGQANHAAANAWLDSFAHYRQARHLPALSIGWGAWSEIGAAAAMVQRDSSEMFERGEGVIDPVQGIESFAYLLQQSDPHVGVMPTNWEKFLATKQVKNPFFANFVHRPNAQQPADSLRDQQKKAMPMSFRTQFEQAMPEQRHTMLMRHLQGIAAKVLGWRRSGQLDMRAGLMDLGMDSLMAIELRNHLQSSLESSLPATLLFSYPTIEELANYLEQELFATDSEGTIQPESLASSSLTKNSTLVPIQPHGSNPALFFVPGVLGMVFDLHQLAHHLSPNQPFHGLRSLGLNEGEELLSHLKDIAAHHIKSLQTVQPQGPYRLGGYSFGGVVAFEMAQQLHNQGHEISRLIIIDINTSSFATPDLAQWDDTRFVTTFAHIQQSMVGEKLGVSLELYRTMTATEQLRHLHERLQRAGSKLSQGDVRRMIDVYKANMLCDFDYTTPQGGFCPITLFRAHELGAFEVLPGEADTQKDPTWGWHELSSNPVDLYMVPGNHFTMMREPHVQVLAEQLRACLENEL